METFKYELVGKEQIIDEVKSEILGLELNIQEYDDKPWGGEFYISVESTDKFIDTFFPEVGKDVIHKYGTDLQPKFLIVLPGYRLSWQYHNRRCELWKVKKGPVGVMQSDTDEMPSHPMSVPEGALIMNGPKKRHRLIGLEGDDAGGGYGVVVEIWQHLDPEHLSDRLDIVRIADDTNRQ